ncbi:TonB-dependent receptor [Methylomonas sp. SURF-2]|uniref:TonB-dependent receptor n=1 Tax=Methylomonas subterranea TaxID=2952225 RepID=A0ABT1TGB4_9GAMM|nr:TonB-dependent receptor [Methylomonas sp. SURF-2]MCQ8104503.1 TonB-dependent receptor [Methylomonas sp. SURF-2]
MTCCWGFIPSLRRLASAVITGTFTSNKAIYRGAPPPTPIAVAIGKIHSHGFEFDSICRITQRLQLLANYSWIGAKFGGGIDLKGNGFGSTPKYSGSAWAMYEAPLALPGKLRLGGGLVYVGRRFGDDANSFKVPGYLRTDLSAHYQIDKLDLRLKVENLLDKRYVSSSIYDDTVIQGNRLLFQFLAGVRF